MIEGFLEIDGQQLRAREQGRGTPILLTPGGPGCCDYLAPVAELIDDAARVIRWEPRGCGESVSPGPYDVETTVADMDEMRQQYGFEKWIVGGHSHGAFFSLAYALTYPQHTLGVIYLSGIGVLRDRAWHIEYADKRDLHGEPEPYFPLPHNMDVNKQGNLSADAWCRDSMLLQRIAGLDVPFLAIQGGKDFRPAWPAEQLVNLLPSATLVSLPEAGHALWLTHEDTLRNMMLAFLDGLPEESTSLN